MTQKQIEQTRVIAEKDGWKIDRSLAYRGMGAIPTHSLDYLTDLNALHKVAMDVMDAMTELFNTTMDGDVFVPASDLEYNIKRACYIRPINGEYIDLFKAVYAAIVFLNENKQ